MRVKLSHLLNYNYSICLLLIVLHKATITYLILNIINELIISEYNLNLNICGPSQCAVYSLDYT